MNQHITYVINKIRARHGITLVLFTKANRELIFNVVGKGRATKVVIDPVNLDVEIIRFDGETFKIVDRGFYINPLNPGTAVERMLQSIA